MKIIKLHSPHTVNAKNICTEKILFKKILFLKSKYYSARNESSN